MWVKNYIQNCSAGKLYFFFSILFATYSLHLNLEKKSHSFSCEQHTNIANVSVVIYSVLVENIQFRFFIEIEDIFYAPWIFEWFRLYQIEKSRRTFVMQMLCWDGMCFLLFGRVHTLKIRFNIIYFLIYWLDGCIWIAHIYVNNSAVCRIWTANKNE